MKKVLCICMCAMMLAACQKSNSEAYNEKVESGLWKVGDAKFHEAYVDFQYADQQDHADEQASTYKKQVNYILEATEASKKGDQQEAIHLLKQCMGVKNGSTLITERAREMKEQIVNN